MTFKERVHISTSAFTRKSGASLPDEQAAARRPQARPPRTELEELLHRAQPATPARAGERATAQAIRKQVRPPGSHLQPRQGLLRHRGETQDLALRSAETMHSECPWGEGHERDPRPYTSTSPRKPARNSTPLKGLVSANNPSISCASSVQQWPAYFRDVTRRLRCVLLVSSSPCTSDPSSAPGT